jgi:TorA maturation chaperone TorD
MQDPTEKALTRSAAYALLGNLIHRGLDEKTLSQVQTLEPLAETLPQPLKLDELAAAHHRFFQEETQPFAGAHLHVQGLCGGEEAQKARAHFSRAGFAANFSDLTLDHLTPALFFLSFLCGAEGDALEDEKPRIVEALQGLQRDFFDAVLLPWWVAYAVSTQDAPRSFWRQVISLTVELVAEHRLDLAHLPEGIAGESLPPRPALLEDPKTSLKDVARLLTTPSLTGMHLGPGQITRLSRQTQIPRGFGAKWQMVENLFHSAVELDALPALFSAWDALLVRQMDHWSTVRLLPALAPFCDVWMERLRETQTLLEEMDHRSAQMLSRQVGELGHRHTQADRVGESLFHPR